MPTVITHMIVAGAVGTFINTKRQPVRFWIFALLCSILPDADVIGYHYFHIPSGHILGHRGFCHSPFFAILLGITAGTLFCHREPIFTRRWFAYVSIFALIAASHGLLDALTNGGNGIALLSPFSNKRYFFPWTPIEVSPLGIRRFLGPRGISVMISEILWIWVPLLSILGFAAFVRVSSRKGKKYGRVLK